MWQNEYYKSYKGSIHYDTKLEFGMSPEIAATIDSYRKCGIDNTIIFQSAYWGIRKKIDDIFPKFLPKIYYYQITFISYFDRTVDIGTK